MYDKFNNFLNVFFLCVCTSHLLLLYFEVTPPWGTVAISRECVVRIPCVSWMATKWGSIKRVTPCRCLDGHVKEPYEMSMALGTRPLHNKNVQDFKCAIVNERNKEIGNVHVQCISKRRTNVRCYFYSSHWQRIHKLHEKC